MKKVLPVILPLLMMMPFGAAQPYKPPKLAGNFISPSNPIPFAYKADVFLDKVAVTLKIKSRGQVADERATEVYQMSMRNLTRARHRAMKHLNHTCRRIRRRARRGKVDNSTARGLEHAEKVLKRVRKRIRRRVRKRPRGLTNAIHHIKNAEEKTEKVIKRRRRRRRRMMKEKEKEMKRWNRTSPPRSHGYRP